MTTNSSTSIHVSLFDFDGTLTTLDTLPAFIAHAVGRWRMLVGFGLYLPLIVLMKLHLYANGRVKERLFAHFFKEMTLETFDAHCQSFAKNNAHILRPQGIKAIETACQRGESVLIVSASITNWVLPFFRQLPQVQVIGTQIAVENGEADGAICLAQLSWSRKSAARGKPFRTPTPNTISRPTATAKATKKC